MKDKRNKIEKEGENWRRELGIKNNVPRKIIQSCEIHTIDVWLWSMYPETTNEGFFNCAELQLHAFLSLPTPAVIQ